MFISLPLFFLSQSINSFSFLLRLFHWSVVGGRRNITLEIEIVSVNIEEYSVREMSWPELKEAAISIQRDSFSSGGFRNALLQRQSLALPLENMSSRSTTILKLSEYRRVLSWRNVMVRAKRSHDFRAKRSFFLWWTPKCLCCKGNQ